MASDPHRPAHGAPLTLFLSYSRTDRAIAEQLAEALEQAGHTVWWDALIEGGANFSTLDPRGARRRRRGHRAVVGKLGRVGLGPRRGGAGPRPPSARPLVDRWQPAPARLSPVSGDRPGALARRCRCARIRRDPPRGRDRGGPVGLARAAARDVEPARPGRVAAAIADWRRCRDAACGRRCAGCVAERVRPERRPAGAVDRRAAVQEPQRRSRAGLFRRRPDRGSARGARRQRWPPGRCRDELGQGAAPTTPARPPSRASSASLILLDGSVQRSNDVVRIATSLTDGKTGFTSWSQSIDRKLSDIFAVQTEIARTVSQALHIRIATDAPAPGGTRNIAAYENFLHGRALFNLAKDEATDRSALAYLDLAVVGRPELRHGARRAVAVVDGDRGRICSGGTAPAPLCRGDRRGAARARHRPRSCRGQSRARLCTVRGQARRQSGAALLRKGLCARPRQGRHRPALRALLLARRPRRGSAQRDQPRHCARSAQPAHLSRRRLDRLCRAPVCGGAGAARSRAGAQSANQQFPRAASAIASSSSAGWTKRARRSRPSRTLCFATPDWRSSSIATAIAPPPTRTSQRSVPTLGDSALYQQAEVLAQWGRTDDALTALERAHRIGDSGLIYAATDPLLDPLRAQPALRERYQGD